MFNKPRNYNGGKKILINFKKAFSQYNIEEEQLNYPTSSIIIKLQ